MHAFIFVHRSKLFFLPHQLHQLHYYCSEWVAYLYSSQLYSLLLVCSLYRSLSFLPLNKYTRRVQKIRQPHVWHEIVSWDCRFKHVMSTCGLCHCTAMSGYHTYVDWRWMSARNMADFEVWIVFWFLYVMWVAPVKIHSQLVTVYWNMCNTMKTGRYGAWPSTVAGNVGTKHVHYRWCEAYRRVQLLTLPESYTFTE